jgi:hypothetical protein
MQAMASKDPTMPEHTTTIPINKTTTSLMEQVIIHMANVDTDTVITILCLKIVVRLWEHYAVHVAYLIVVCIDLLISFC